MQVAQRSAIILRMGEERAYQRHRRENLLRLYQACELAAGKARGGQRIMARILNTTNEYLSDIKRSVRYMGDDVAERIEQRFSLGTQWMDHAHPDVELDWLSKRVPLPPDVQRKSTRAKPPQPRTAAEKYLFEQVEQLRAQLAQARNTPK